MTSEDSRQRPDVDATGREASVRTDSDGDLAVDASLHGHSIFRAVLESMSEAVFVVRPEDRAILLTNPAVSELFGYDPGSLLGKSTRVLYADDQDFEDFGTKSEVSLRENRAFRGSHRFKRSDGTTFDAEVTTTAIDPSDWSRGVVSVVRDVSEARRAKEQLERDRDRFLTLFRTAPLAMALSMPDDGRFMEVNEHWVELSGYSRAELIGATALDLGLWDDPGRREELRKELDREGAVRGFRIDYRWRGVEPRVGLVSIQQLQLDGRPLWFTVLLDRTGEVRLEEERSRLDQQRQVLQRLGALGELAGGIAHDFNNLLLPILINVELALPDATGEAHTRLEEMRDAAVRGRDLTRKLLAFGRRTEAQMERVDLSDVVRSVEPMLRRLIPESVEISVHADSGTKPIMADPVLMEQVVLNLVLNAAAATDGGSVRIGVSNRTIDAAEAEELEKTGPDFDPVVAGEYAYLEVQDTGSGIPESIRARIFEPFFTTKEESSGTGLGLSSVLGIVKQHGGHIVLETEEGVGSRFAIGLPVRRGGAKAPTTPQGSTRSREVGDKRSVLVVEDDDAVRRVTVRALQALGFEVTAAADAQEALLQVDGDGEYDLVISDMVMPGMTGLELRDELRKRHPELPVLFVSGYSADVLAGHGVDRGSVRILEKPFSPDALAAAVEETLQGQEG